MEEIDLQEKLVDIDAQSDFRLRWWKLKVKAKGRKLYHNKCLHKKQNTHTHTHKHKHKHKQQ